MKFGKFLPLLATICSALLIFINLFEGQNHVASIWGIATCWSLTSYINELRLEAKEKLIKELKEFINLIENKEK